MSYRKAIELFFVNGTAESLITAELFNWNGKDIKIPHTEVSGCTRDHLDQSRIAIPTTPVLERFAEIVQPVHAMIGKYQQQYRELIKFRDWLLPMFMNGQAVVE